MRSWLQKHAIQLGLALVLFLSLLGHSLQYWSIKPLVQLESALYDWRLVASMPRGVDPRVVIVDIDEKSLAALGRWPWSRNVLADMMDKLFNDYRAAVVGFDIVFAEPDNSSGLSVLDRLGKGPLRDDAVFQGMQDKLRQELDYDARFAASMQGRNTVLGYYFSGDKDLSSGVLPPPVFTQDDLKHLTLYPFTGFGYGSNLAPFMQSARGAGHFNAEPDEDGVVRRMAMLREYNGNYYAPLSLEMVRAYMSSKLGTPVPIRPILPEAFAGSQFSTLVGLSVGPLQVPVDINAAALVPYRGPQGSFPYVSAVDVLHGKVAPAVLHDRLILFGTSAPGLKDLRVTPVESRYAGVEAHANLIAGILDENIPVTPDYMPAVEALVLLLSTLVLTALVLHLSPRFALLGTVLWLAAVTGLSFYLWSQQQVVMPLAAATLLTIGLYVTLTVYGYFFETRHKRELSQLFGRYVPPELVAKMSENPESYTMEGQAREITVLFSDVRGFTTISESMEPKELTRLMNEFLSALSKVIRVDYLGTIDKYMGDCVMAFWNAPFLDAEHPKRAVHAALAMQQAMKDLQPVLREHGWPLIEIGVGVNTGRATVGDMGSVYRKAYTVMGDSVNLASRLEGLTRRYGVGILVGEGTRQLVDDVVFREIDRVRVKGKVEAVTIYEPLGLQGSVDAAVIDADRLFQRALKLYRQQDWDMAELQLLNLQNSQPHGLYELYLQRIAQWRVQPPPADWDGSHTFESK